MSELKQLLWLAAKDSYFIFNGLLYKQTDGVAMGSPLGHSLTNAFLSCHEKTGYTVLRKDLNQFFNDIFFLFKSNYHLKYFQEFLYCLLWRQKDKTNFFSQC